MQNFYAKTTTPQILESRLNEIARLIGQMNLTKDKLLLINVKIISDGSITGSFSHDKFFFFKVQYNFITVWRRGFLCREAAYKLLVKHNLDIIFSPGEPRPNGEEEDKCCALF